jgi:hypothetical protein
MDRTAVTTALPQTGLKDQALTIEGEALAVAYREMPLRDVQLDLTNPRIQYILRQSKNGKPTQDELTKLILDIHGVPALFASIRDNKGLLEPIYVRPDGRVIEGNCRAAAYMRLLSIDRKKGVSNSNWEAIPAFVVPKISERQVAVLQGRVHVAGKNKWRAYEKAGHVHSMYTNLRMDPKTIGQLLSMSEGEVLRDIRAYETITEKFLPKMKGVTGLEKWSFFEEFFKRKGLEEYRAKPANVNAFVAMVQTGKLKRGADVRKLEKILKHKGALKVLKHQGVDMAMEKVGQADPTADSPTFHQLKKTVRLLKEFPTKDLDRLRGDDKPQQILQELFTAAKVLAKAAGVKLS